MIRPFPSAEERAFTARLLTIATREDRAALAAMRRGLRDSVEFEAIRVVAPLIPEGARDEDAFYLVAALFALMASGTSGVRRGEGNLGHAFGAMRRHDRGSDSTEKRFTALLAAHPDDLPHHLSHSMTLLRAVGISPDWAQMLHDVRTWSHPDQPVQRRWAQSYQRIAIPRLSTATEESASAGDQPDEGDTP